jgi:hypothetical protein
MVGQRVAGRRPHNAADEGEWNAMTNMGLDYG